MMGSTREWTFSQCFGEKVATEDLTEADVLSAVEYDETGRYLATGDKGGRIVVFELDGADQVDTYQSQSREQPPSPMHNNLVKNNSIGSETVDQSFTPTSEQPQVTNSFQVPQRSGPRTVQYKFHCEFQSHEPEFDYLKSLEIEEKINKIRWCKPSNNSLFLLSTNDKTIKLWKVYEKQMKTVMETNMEHKSDGQDAGRRGAFKAGNIPIRIPKLQRGDFRIASQSRRTYANAHAYHINSISLNSDGETYLSADDLRINLWNIGISDQSYNIVDIKPVNMEELSEVITSSEFHPSHCNIFMYSSSRGNIKLGDMRDRALCDSHSKLFQEDEESAANKSFFSEIIASISDIKFSKDGRYIVSRDYLTLKIWDVNMESKPVKTIQIHEHLRSKLCDLYENDCIFDKFECCISGDGNNLMTGSYNNMFHIYNRHDNSDICIEASQIGPKMWNNDSTDRNQPIPESLDYENKVMNLAWHPHEDTVAIAGLNNLFIYSR